MKRNKENEMYFEKSKEIDIEFEEKLESIKKTNDVENISLDKKEKQDYLNDLIKVYKETSEKRYELLKEINNYINSKEEKIENVKDLRIEIYLKYMQSNTEKTKIINEIFDYNTKKIQKIINSLSIEIEKQNDKLENQKTEIKNQNDKLKENSDEIASHDKKALETMGIFLAVFLLIGMNVSFLGNAKELRLWEIIFLCIIVNLVLVDSIKAVFNIIRKEKIEIFSEKMIKKIINCIQKKEKDQK